MEKYNENAYGLTTFESPSPCKLTSWLSLLPYFMDGPLQFMTMKVCYRQKTFSPSTEISEISAPTGCFCWSYLCKKYLTCCFESLWACLTTSTWNNWLNLLLYPYHMQKTNFVSQLLSLEKDDSIFFVTLSMLLHVVLS